MKMTTASLMAFLALGVTASAMDAGANASPKILVAYYTRTNNTGGIAEYVHTKVGGDIFQVRPKNAYPADYREATQVARAELDNNQRPEVAESIAPADMTNYDVIFLGHPIWWGTMPMFMYTFLEQYDLSGKVIIPFCTHGGGGAGTSVRDIARIAPGAEVREGLALRGGLAQNEVDNWLRKNGFDQ